MHFKKIKTLKSLKKCLKKTIPEKVSQVMESYESFAEQPIPEDAKGFSAHHSACKSAVVHAETLLKLAKWTDEDNALSSLQPQVPTEDMLNLLEEAHNELGEIDDEEN